jgi:hemerythrin-like domain-containing protein
MRRGAFAGLDGGVNMRATEILMSEHRGIERMLTVVETAAVRLEQRQALPPTLFADAGGFFSAFADRCHHGKEERHLFPLLVERGIPREGGPIGVMLAEHEQGRGYVRTLRTQAALAAAGTLSDPQALLTAARSYVALLRQHIQKEDRVLFRMADQVLSTEDQQALSAAFEAVEREEMGVGEHERYHAMIEELERSLQ